MKTSDVFIGALDLSPYFRSLRSFVSYESSRRGREIFFAFPPNELAHETLNNLFCLRGDMACYVLKRRFFGRIGCNDEFGERARSRLFLQKRIYYEYSVCVNSLRWEEYDAD